MYRIARIRMSSIGPDDARFDRPSARLPRFELDFTSSHRLIDSVVWLENGGGKTVFLTLLFHALRPDHAAQIGDEHGKRGGLEDFVRSDDVAHVQVEWHACDAAGTPQGERVVTGLVAERRARAAASDKVDKTWYALVVRDPAFTLEDLATEAEGRRIPKRVFVDTLRERAKGAGRRSLDLRTATTQAAWLTALSEIGLDPALLEYQVTMNRKESGAASLFRFPTDERFLWFFLELVTDAEALDAADETVTRVADKLTSLPAKEREVRFAEGALPYLERVAAEQRRAQAAATSLSETRESARSLGARLASAVAEARELEKVENGRAEAADARALTDDRRRRALDDERRLLAIALAGLKVAAAQRAVDAASDVETRARTEREAWGAVPLRLDVDRARARAQALAIAFATVEKDAEPLRRSRDLAGSLLRRRLLVDSVLLRAEFVDSETRQKTLRDAMNRAWSRAGDLKAEARELRSNARGLTARLEAHNAAIASAAESSMLRASETPASGVARVDDTIASEERRLDAITAERRSLREARPPLEKEYQSLVKAASRAEQTARNDAETAVGARTERSRFTGDARIADAAGVGLHEVELDAVGAAVVDRLDANARAADGRRIDIELRGANDRRAVESLDGGAALLPPRPEVAEIIERLRASGIPNASTGWRHLADATDPAHRTAVLAAVPALADGIVVARSSLPRVVSALEGVALHPATTVVVGTVEAMQAAEAVAHAPSDHYVVPPAAALYDRAAATVELEVRRERLDRLDEECAALDKQAYESRNLATDLRGHLERWRPGMIALAETAALLSAERHSELMAQSDATAEQLARMTEREALLTDQAEEIEGRIAAHRVVLELLTRLATEARDLEGAPATVGRLSRQADDAETEETRQREEATTAQSQLETMAGRLAELKMEASRATQDAMAVEAPHHDDERQLVAAKSHDPDVVGLARTIAAMETVAMLRESFVTMDSALRAATTESQVAVELKVAESSLSVAEQRWTLVLPRVRERTEELATTPHADDPVALDAAMRAANVAIEEARGANDRAKGALTLAQNARKELPRPAIATAKLEIAPITEEDAAQRHAETVLAHDAAVANAAAARVEGDAARAAAAAAKERARILWQQAGVLAGAVREERQDAGDTTPFPGTPEEAQELVNDLSGRVASIARDLDEATSSWRQHAARLNAFAREETWSAMQGAVYRRLAHDPVEQLARDASDLVAQLTLLRARLSGEIESMSDHRRALVRSLGELVGSGISNLKQAHSRSRLPDHLGDWSHKPFLKIDFEAPSETEIEQRLSTYVIELIEMGRDKRPTGKKLVTAALLKCVSGGVKVSVLKPNRMMALTYVSIGDMAILSGGMRATAAIAMFCTLARLRAANRTQARDKGVATLILDNPFGDASAPYLVSLQRTVADGAGIQLVYTTGIKDLDALRQFPNPIRLSNQSSRRAGLAYVTGDPDFVKQLWPEGDEARLEMTKVQRTHAGPVLP